MEGAARAPRMRQRPATRPREAPPGETSRTPPVATAGATTAAVLALQGSVEPHLRALGRCGVRARSVRQPRHLEGVTHLVIPGGESTTLARLLRIFGLWDPIADRGRSGELALFGTCAGAILLGRPALDPPPRLGLIDVAVERNAYGRQVDSFTAPIEWSDPRAFPGRACGRAPESVEGVFIRAPVLRHPGPAVEILARHRGDPVLVRQGRLLAATFHPELTSSEHIHRAFLSM